MFHVHYNVNTGDGNTTYAHDPHDTLPAAIEFANALEKCSNVTEIVIVYGGTILHETKFEEGQS